LWRRGILSCVTLIFVLLVLIQPINASSNLNNNSRLVLTLLAPKIQEQVNKYYKEKLTVSPTYAPFLDPVNMLVGYFDSHIDLIVTITPYVGPHLSVGMDTTLKIDNRGTVEVLEYEHIKDYALPPNWKYIIRKNNEFKGTR